MRAKPDLIWSVLQLSVLAGLLLEHEVWVWFLVSLLCLCREKRLTEPKSSSQTCLDHVITLPRVQMLPESFIDVLHIPVSVPPNSRSFVRVILLRRGNTNVEKNGLDSSLCFPAEECLKGHIIHLTQVVFCRVSHTTFCTEKELHLANFLSGQHAYVSGDRGGGPEATETSATVWRVSHRTCRLASA